jgi:integrase
MAKKRSRQSHTGSVYQSGGVWYAAVMVGKVRRRVRASSKAEANAKLTELRKVAEASSSLQPSTFGGFRQRWLDHVKVNKSLKTAQSYEYAVDHFSSLDALPMERITGQSIQQVVDALSGRTRQQAFDKCKQMLQTAVRWKCIASNPMEHLDRPAHDKAAVDPFELREVELIIDHTQETRYGAAIALAFACGLRGGELWGLQWADLKGNELTINRQACESAGKLEIKLPKTAAGVRRIMLPDSVVDALAIRRAHSVKEGNAANPWLFPGENGGTTRRTNFGYRVWKPALQALKIRHRGFHHARHTAATLLLNAAAVPLAVVSKMLGHASPKITLETYAHVMVADFEKHRNAFDRVIKVKAS